MEDRPDSTVGGPAALSREDRAYMAAAAATVREFLDENGWQYDVREVRADLMAFELSLGVNGVRLSVRIFVEADPGVCRIDAVLPIMADAAYEYPLCRLLAEENRSRFLGAFQYNGEYGQVSFRSCFITPRGLYRDELEAYFDETVRASALSYDKIRRYCVGRYGEREVDEILKKVRDLVSDISR